jgi:flagellar basal-body rod modification protein FlgD
MQVNSIIDTINQVSTTQSTSTGFGSADFMQMLMTQLTHQDPLEPMNDSEMMNQITQLNSLQQLEQINTSIQQSAQNNQSTYAASLIGKMVSISTNGTSKEGRVTGFSIVSGTTNVQLDNDSYPLDEVMKVWEE